MRSGHHVAGLRTGDCGEVCRRRVVTKTVRAAIRIVTVVNRRVPNPQRRVEPPAERTVEDSVTGQPGVGPEPWVPVPARTVPTRSARIVLASDIDVGLCQVGGAQVAEAIQIAGLERV